VADPALDVGLARMQAIAGLAEALRWRVDRPETFQKLCGTLGAAWDARRVPRWHEAGMTIYECAVAELWLCRQEPETLFDIFCLVYEHADALPGLSDRLVLFRATDPARYRVVASAAVTAAAVGNQATVCELLRERFGGDGLAFEQLLAVIRRYTDLNPD
jgi:hypothetical protein